MSQTVTDHNWNQALRLAAEGDGDAWRLILERYATRVFALLLRQCGNRDLAEEITQATFVKVLVSLGDYQEQGRFEPWLFRIAMNQLRDEIRRRKRQATPMDMSGGDGSDESNPWAAVETKIVRRDSPEDHSPFEEASRAEQIARMQAAVAQMSEADQEILYLRHTAGLTFPQIAESLDQPLGTVLARGHRALGKLRKMLAEDADFDGNA